MSLLSLQHELCWTSWHCARNRLRTPTYQSCQHSTQQQSTAYLCEATHRNKKIHTDCTALAAFLFFREYCFPTSSPALHLFRVAQQQYHVMKQWEYISVIVWVSYIQQAEFMQPALQLTHQTNIRTARILFMEKAFQNLCSPMLVLWQLKIDKGKMATLCGNLTAATIFIESQQLMSLSL